MGKMKMLLEEDMEKNPELYNGWSDYEFWIQCRKEAILERKGINNKNSSIKKGKKS